MSMFNWFSNSRSRFNVKKTKVNLDKKYEISSLDDHIFLHIPKFRFYGMALSSPSSKYLISSCRNMLALVDDDEKQILLIVRDVLIRLFLLLRHMGIPSMKPDRR